MPRFAGVICLMALLTGDIDVVSADDAATPMTPEWIWVDAVNFYEEAHFAKALRLDFTPVNARLQIAADYCDVAIEVNGQVVLRLESFAPTQTLDVSQHLFAGVNVVAITADPQVGPAAVALSIVVTDADGHQTSIVSDESWSAIAVDSGDPLRTQSLGAVAPEMWGVGARSIEISPFDDYEQWRRASGDDGRSDSGRFWVRDGFEIELVKAADPDEGSWVALAFDDAGRLTVAREDRGLLRFSFDQPGGQVTDVETTNDELLECRGLVYVGSTLYACANNSHAVYQLEDHDGDGVFDESAIVREFPGGVGHGRNQLAIDGGALWMIGGDDVDIPTDIFDHTSPFREARRGEQTREGWLARFDFEDEAWQVYSAGLRNPFGVAFNRDGEAFTYDADAEYDMGTPWYRPTRLLHLRSGADFGWRGVTGSWPPYDPDHPDNAQPLLDIGKGSPTAVDFGYDSNFPSAYREALYILDWSYGRVLAVHLTPRGGTYRAQAETFLQGSPLNVTGIDFGPDGAMYLVTGGRSTKSALYRVRHVVGGVEEHVPSAHDSRLVEHATRAVAVRRELESWHGPGLIDIGFSLEHLASRDPSIRNAAEIALEHQRPESWDALMLEAELSRRQLVGLMALIRGGNRELARPVLERLLQYEFATLEVDLQLTLLHAIALCRKLDAGLTADFRDVLVARLDQHFPGKTGELRVSAYGTSVDVDRELARLLVDLDAPGIVPRCIAEMERSTTQENKLHYLLLLRDATSGWSHETHHAYFTALREADGFTSGEGMPKFLQLIRESATAHLTEATRSQLASLLAPIAEEEEPAVIDRPLVREWTFAELNEILSSSDYDPSAERGAIVFQQALCVRCHRVGASGPAVGPDLTFVGRRFSREDMLQSIVVPNQVVAENYRNVEVVTLDGRIITGRPLTAGDYRSSIVRIAVNPLRPSEIVELPKQEIDVLQVSDTSPMPAGLLNTFTDTEVADLLAYLARGPVAAE